MLFEAVITTLAAVAGVSAHGFAGILSGPTPDSNNDAPSPIRKVMSVYPVTNVSDPNINCGIGAKEAALVAAANPGDKVTIKWKGASTPNWGHTMGPIMTYLAQVPAGQTADKFNTQHAKFFKIDQAGQTGGPGSPWVQARMMGGMAYAVTLPNDLPASDYIMRHELIALHYANITNGAQHYPACIQLRIGGGSNAPKAISAPTVSFPGGYTANEKGLLVPDLRKPDFVYTFPGPPVVKSLGAASGNSSMNLGNSTIEDEGNRSKCKNQKRSARLVYW
ncbi:Endoglucanase-4 [Rhizoctonia solani]|uniref:lytic cellulose monooxygenase (C4-dehydrogenating) n=1 Tax=Rhizoctonia solani TaxID=456999 RepID=A0A0K6G361_9AGAM|nr:Endoglucanase-4 [Rhizoctonia solani]